MRIPLARRLALLGALNAGCLAAHAILSYGLAPAGPFGESQPNEAAVARALAGSLRALGPDVQAFVTGETLRRPALFAAAYAIPLLASSGVFLALLASLWRSRRELTEETVRRLFRWSVGFVAVAALALPAVVQDFWLSVAWGRMLAGGVSPYHADLHAGVLAGVPLDYLDQRMTYGPLWAVLAGLVSALAGERTLLAAALFKLLLGVAWIGALTLVLRLLRQRPAWDRCVALAILGWMPLGVLQGVAEGHNDVVLGALVLLWLERTERARGVPASLALGASVLIKYVSAPLFLLDALVVRARGLPLRSYLPRLAAVAALAAASLAVVYRSPDFFSAVLSMSGWHFYTPADAVIGLAKTAGVEPGLASVSGAAALLLAGAVRALFVLAAGVSVLRYARSPSPRRLRSAVLATMAGVLFGASGHLWPWFLIWALGPAALLPGAVLSRWVVGVAIAAPFPLLVWLIAPAGDAFSIPTVALYAFACAWTALGPRHWFATDAPDGVGAAGYGGETPPTAGLPGRAAQPRRQGGAGAGR
ncbi:MAG: glycosyltransferase 87 family protein [Gemmatimonadota bacterium]